MDIQQLGLGLIIGLLLGAGSTYIIFSQQNSELEVLRQQYDTVSTEYQQLQDIYLELQDSYHDLETNVEDMVQKSEYNLLEQELSQTETRIDNMENQIDRFDETERVLKVELNLYQWLYQRVQGEREWRKITGWNNFTVSDGILELDTGYFHVNDNDLLIEQIMSTDIFESYELTVFRIDAQGNEHDIWERVIDDAAGRSLSYERQEVRFYGIAAENMLHRIEIRAKLKQEYIDAINNGSLILHIGGYDSVPDTPFIQIDEVIVYIPE
jgi:hypothetical protein